MKKKLLLLVVGLLLTTTYALTESRSNSSPDFRRIAEKGIAEYFWQNPNEEFTPDNAPAYYPKAYQPKRIIGFLLGDNYGTQGFVDFSLTDLSSMNLLFPDNPDYINYKLAIGAYGNGTYYYFMRNESGYAANFSKVDLNTGVPTVFSDYLQENVQIIQPYDMTYDYSSNTMYGLVTSNKDNFYAQRLVTIRLTDGYAEDIAILPAMYAALAASYDGHLYAIKEDGNLVEFNKEDGTEKTIFDTTFKPHIKARQSMDFDHTDGKLYWALTEEGYTGKLIAINIQEKTAEELGILGRNAQMSGMYIPFMRNDLNAPLPASELELIPSAEGKTEAELKWKNPEFTINEDPITSLTKVEVYRDNELIKTFDSPAPTVGGAMSMKDTNIPNGLNTYKVIAYNSAGEGAPANISLSKKDGSETSILLTWDAPETGANGGWIDHSTLTYTITRLPDGTVVASKHKGESYEENIIELKTYYYRIESETSDGKGKIAESNHIPVGEACSIPYLTNFIYTDESDLWTTLNPDGGYSSWEFDGFDLFYFSDERPGSAIHSSWGPSDA